MRRTWRPQPIVHQPLEVTMGSKFAAFTHQPDKQDRYIPGQVAYEDESILRAVYADGVSVVMAAPCKQAASENRSRSGRSVAE